MVFGHDPAPVPLRSAVGPRRPTHLRHPRRLRAEPLRGARARRPICAGALEPRARRGVRGRWCRAYDRRPGRVLRDLRRGRTQHGESRRLCVRGTVAARRAVGRPGPRGEARGPARAPRGQDVRVAAQRLQRSHRVQRDSGRPAHGRHPHHTRDRRGDEGQAARVPRDPARHGHRSHRSAAPRRPARDARGRRGGGGGRGGDRGAGAGRRQAGADCRGRGPPVPAARPHRAAGRDVATSCGVVVSGARRVPDAAPAVRRHVPGCGLAARSARDRGGIRLRAARRRAHQRHQPGDLGKPAHRTQPAHRGGPRRLHRPPPVRERANRSRGGRSGITPRPRDPCGDVEDPSRPRPRPKAAGPTTAHR